MSSSPTPSLADPISATTSISISISALASISTSASKSWSQGTYRPRLTSRQKADKILRDIHRDYKWTIKDLIRSMVFDDPEGLYNYSAHERCGRLIRAIWGEIDILQKLHKHPSF